MNREPVEPSDEPRAAPAATERPAAETPAEKTLAAVPPTAEAPPSAEAPPAAETRPAAAAAPPTSSDSRLADLALLGVVAIWGVNIPVMKTALGEMNPFAFNAARLACSALTLAVLASGLPRARRRAAARPRLPPSTAPDETPTAAHVAPPRSPAQPAPPRAGQAPAPAPLPPPAPPARPTAEQRSSPAAEAGSRDLPRTAAFPWWRVSAAGLLGSLVYQVLFVSGMARTTGGNTALLIASSPMWTALIAWVCAVERLRRGAWLGLSLAFVGTAAITADTGDVAASSAALVGNLLVLVSAVVWGGYTVMSKPLLTRMPATRLAFWMTALAVPFHVLLAVPHLDELPRASFGTWLCIVYSGAFSTGVAYAWWNYGVAQVGPSNTAIYNNLVPVLALLGSWAMLGESISLAQVAGGVLVLGGLLVMRRARRPRPAT